MAGALVVGAVEVDDRPPVRPSCRQHQPLLALPQALCRQRHLLSHCLALNALRQVARYPLRSAHAAVVERPLQLLLMPQLLLRAHALQPQG